MADFVAVLRKTIGTLGDNTPEMREKVFEKARATIEAKLAALEPAPPAAVIERQRKALEDAIAAVRADYAAPEPRDAGDGLEEVLAALDQPASIPVTPMPAPRRSAPEATAAPEPEPAPARDDGIAARPLAAPAGSGGRRRTGLVALAAGLVVVAIAAGGGYYWLGGDGPATPAGDAPAVAEAPQEDAATTAGDLAPEPAAAEPEAPAPQQAAAPAPPPAAAPANGPEKFTQRLLADGSEVDEGPAGGRPGIGEGSSVASAVQPPAPPPAETPAQTPAETSTETPDAPAMPAAGEEPAPATQTAAPAEPAPPAPHAAALPVGQRAIFYEERTSAAEGSAEMGAIVWSLVQESPGGDLPPEPAIRAEATIPGKDVQLRMTIRRNGDKTLPASHIVEMIFLTPDGFDGGAISSVSRIAFKETEQAPGNPLIGIPAKIADGFFLIALSDATAEAEMNLNLLRRQSWVDIPIVYQTGRRALLSMEKGVPGERVFEDALRAWSEAGSG